MKLTSTALNNPAGLAVIVALLVVFGLYAIVQLPVQLFPNIERPVIAVQTAWRAASPREIESEIIEPQEDILQGLPGLESMSANANQGFAWINLEFALDTDMQQTLIEVISRMTRLPPLPRDATPPQIMLGGWGGGGEALTYFFLQTLPGSKQSLNDNVDFVTDVIRPRIEAIPGVASVTVESGAEREELQIRFDANKLADYQLTLPDVVGRVSGSNDISGGFLDVGRRQYTLRFTGKYEPEEMRDLILEWRNGVAVRLGDVATVDIRPADRANLAVQNGNPAFSIRVNRQSGANVLDTLNNVKAEVEKINTDLLAEKELRMVQSFDASVFIYRAINLVTSNLFFGVALSIGILWIFVRRMRATLMIALAIPTSLLATFIMLQITGRSLNVISLAGLAFAVGMVLDAAIVVMENIIRLRDEGVPGEQAADKGATQVWGALLASTTTTVAIFLPVFFLKDIEGQLFGDLALTIAIAVSISLLVAVTVLPVMARLGLKGVQVPDRFAKQWDRITAFVMNLTSTGKKRAMVLATLMIVPVTITWLAMPKLDYLPPVKRDAVDAFFQFPPGVNIDTVEEEVVKPIIARLQPYMDGEKQPALKNYYIIIGGWGGTIGVRALDQSRVDELLNVVRSEVLVDLPDTRAFANQGNLFGGFGGGRSVNLHLQSRDTQALLAAARHGMDRIQQVIDGAMVQPQPGLELAEPELRLSPNDRLINEQGWSRRDLGTIVRALGDGVYVGEYFDGAQRQDMIFRSDQGFDPDSLGDVPLYTPAGNVLPLRALVDIERTVGPTRLQRIDRNRTISLFVNPPEGWSLEETIDAIKTQVEPELRAMLPADGNILYGGSADQLSKAISTMGENFLMALLVLFLLLSALFRSIKDSALVLLSLPLATVGGVLAMRLLNLVTFQPLDLLTMIGFIILLGLVINNAILLVHQTRSAEREGLSRHHAVEQALRTRLRPIFMSTLTSLFGMLPLVLMPGAGSVIYRGLATVIVGGLTVSTVFTIVLLPCLLRLGETRLSVLQGERAKREPAKLESVA